MPLWGEGYAQSLKSAKQHLRFRFSFSDGGGGGGGGGGGIFDDAEWGNV